MKAQVLYVSIPRSEFWSFGPAQKPQPLFNLIGFNSSVGILVVRTKPHAAYGHGCVPVSIPRSEFWSFGRAIAPSTAGNKSPCFNSSVGILVVRTYSLSVPL